MTLDEQLLAAAALAQADEVAALIKRGANVNAADEDGETTLMKAAKSKRKGRVDTVRCLIESGANVNQKDRFGITALMEAVSGRVDSSLETIKLLINAGANINDSSALEIAVEKKSDSRVRLLVEHGAKINSTKEAEEIFDVLWNAAWNKNTKGNVTQILEYLTQAGLFRTGASKEKMLASAMYGGRDEHTEIARFLIRSGANIKCLQEELHHFFSNAVRKSNFGTLALIVKSGLKSQHLDFEYELHTAAKYGHIEIVKLLIESGASIDTAKAYVQQEEMTRNIAHWASSYLEHERGAHLLECMRQSANLSHGKKDHHLALLHAATFGDTETALRLINQERVDIDTIDEDGRTPIIISAIYNHINVVKILVAAGADVNRVDTKGCSALSYALLSGTDIAPLLIDLGANVNNVNVEGCTPLMFAVAQMRDIETISSIIERGASVNIKRSDGNTALIDAVRIGYEDAIKILLDANAQTNAINDEGWSALMGAAYRWDVSIMGLLIDAGANVNAKNNEGETALTKAIVSSRWPPDSSDREVAVQWLIEHGADVNVVDKDGWSLLKKAAWRGQTSIAKLLINAGAKTDVVDNGGWTALMAAEREGHKEIVALLKKAGARK